MSAGPCGPDSEPEPGGAAPRCNLPAPENHAGARPGLRAPHPSATSEEWERLSVQLGYDATVEAARTLFRVMRYPMKDPVYAHLKPRLMIIESVLQKALRERPDDDVVALYLQEVRTFLPRRQH